MTPFFLSRRCLRFVTTITTLFVSLLLPLPTTYSWYIIRSSAVPQRRHLFATSNGGNGKQQQQNPRPQCQQKQYRFQQEQKRINKQFRNDDDKDDETQKSLSRDEVASSDVSNHHFRKVVKFGADSRISSRHQERLKTAGREGTKRYRNPNKVFLGNLSFNITSLELENWLSSQYSIPAALLLKQCKVIRDWRTGNSKGYGFAVFSEPIYATLCLEKCHGLTVQGRDIQVSPGYKKIPDPAIYLLEKKKKNKNQTTTGLSPTKKKKWDPVDVKMLRRLDPDLVGDDDDNNDVDHDDGQMEELDMEEEQLLLLEEEEEEYDDDDENEMWVEDLVVDDQDDDNVETRDSSQDPSGNPMNRQQRRHAGPKRSKRKISHKGFG